MSLAAGARLGGVADQASIGKCDARRTEQLARIPVVGGRDRLLRPVRQSRQRSGRRTAVQHGEGPRSILDRGEYRNAGVGENPRGLALEAHGVHHDRLAMRVSNFRHAGGDIDLRAGQALAVVSVPAEVAGDQNRVDVRAGEHGVENGDEGGDVLFARPGEVDGVRDAG